VHELIQFEEEAISGNCVAITISSCVLPSSAATTPTSEAIMQNPYPPATSIV
jgi:hypothetical protein